MPPRTYLELPLTIKQKRLQKTTSTVLSEEKGKQGCCFYLTHVKDLPAPLGKSTGTDVDLDLPIAMGKRK